MFNDIGGLNGIAFSFRFGRRGGNRISSKQLLGPGFGIEHGQFEFFCCLETISRIHFHGFFNGSRKAAGNVWIALAQRCKLSVIHGAGKAIFRDDTGQGRI